jgi:hypothetical protein
MHTFTSEAVQGFFPQEMLKEIKDATKKMHSIGIPGYNLAPIST